MGCALVALVAPRGQLRQPQQLVWELSRCRALWGCPKVFLLLSTTPGGEWAGQGHGFGDGLSRGGGGQEGQALPSRPVCHFNTQLPLSPEPSSLA